MGIKKCERVLVKPGERLLAGLSLEAVVRAYLHIRTRRAPETYALIFPDDVYEYINVDSNHIKDEDTRR